MSGIEQTITPYLICQNTAQAIAFYVQAFGAVELSRIVEADGKVGHAELQIGNCKLMISDEFPEINVYSPQHYGGSSVAISLFVDDADQLAQRAINAGIEVLRPMADQGSGLGIRTGIFQCPYKHRWFMNSKMK